MTAGPFWTQQGSCDPLRGLPAQNLCRVKGNTTPTLERGFIELENRRAQALTGLSPMPSV